MSSEEVQDAISVLMKNAKELMQGKSEYQEVLAKQQAQTVEATAGNCVTAVVSLKLEVTEIRLGEKFTKETPEVMADLIKSAVNQALLQAKETGKSQMSNMAKQMGFPPA